MAWEAQYREERIAWEFGAGFEIVPRSRILFGPAITEGDCHAVTEAGWFLERGIVRWPFPEDVFQVKYIHVDKGEAGERQGLGVVLRNTSAAWLPSGHTVFAIVAEFNVAQKMFLHAVNPW